MKNKINDLMFMLPTSIVELEANQKHLFDELEKFIQNNKMLILKKYFNLLRIGI